MVILDSEMTTTTTMTTRKTRGYKWRGKVRRTYPRNVGMKEGERKGEKCDPKLNCIINQTIKMYTSSWYSRSSPVINILSTHFYTTWHHQLIRLCCSPTLYARLCTRTPFGWKRWWREHHTLLSCGCVQKVWLCTVGCVCTYILPTEMCVYWAAAVDSAFI